MGGIYLLAGVKNHKNGHSYRKERIKFCETLINRSETDVAMGMSKQFEHFPRNGGVIFVVTIDTVLQPTPVSPIQRADKQLCHFS